MAKTLPKTGTPREAVMQQLKALHSDDAKWKDGKTFSLVYFAGDEVSLLLKEAYGEFIAEKHRLDPGGVFSSDWFRHHERLLGNPS